MAHLEPQPEEQGQRQGPEHSRHLLRLQLQRCPGLLAATTVLL